MKEFAENNQNYNYDNANEMTQNVALLRKIQKKQKTMTQIREHELLIHRLLQRKWQYVSFLCFGEEVILTRFKEQAKYLYDGLKNMADDVFLLYGDNLDKKNADIRAELKRIPQDETLILIATGQKIGEGFDFPRLDVLMLAVSVSFEGHLEQYVGRLNRDYERKKQFMYMTILIAYSFL